MHFNGGSVSVILLSPLFINLNYPLPFGVIVSFLFIVLKFYFKTKTCLGKFVVSFDIYQILKLFLYHKPQTIKIPYVCSLFSFLKPSFSEMSLLLLSLLCVCCCCSTSHTRCCCCCCCSCATIALFVSLSFVHVPLLLSLSLSPSFMRHYCSLCLSPLFMPYCLLRSWWSLLHFFTPLIGYCSHPQSSTFLPHSSSLTPISCEYVFFVVFSISLTVCMCLLIPLYESVLVFSLGVV